MPSLSQREPSFSLCILLIGVTWTAEKMAKVQQTQQRLLKWVYVSDCQTRQSPCVHVSRVSPPGYDCETQCLVAIAACRSMPLFILERGEAEGQLLSGCQGRGQSICTAAHMPSKSRPAGGEGGEAGQTHNLGVQRASEQVMDNGHTHTHTRL